MRKQYRKLTQEQKQRGVIFSSQLMPGDTIHEVLRPKNNTSEEWDEAQEKINRLKDDKFFNNSPFKYNEIRT